MTAREQLNRRLETALDRLAWGFGDARRLLVERGLWPAAAPVLAAPDGARYRLAATRLRPAAGSARPQGLLVPEGDSLWGTLQLPDMPRRQLGQAVEEALWRVSPLPPDQVWCAWSAAPLAQGGWGVEWGACRRDQQGAALSHLGLAADAPLYLARAGQALPVRGAGWPAQQRRQRWLDGLALLGLLCLAAALAMPALMPLALKRQAVVRAMQHVGDLEPKAAPLRPQLDELRQQAGVADNLRQAVASADLPLASVIEALSEALPDDSWLERVEISGNDIRITGVAGNAGDLATRLGRHGGFVDVRASAASVRDSALGKERFTLEMRWRTAQTEGAKP
ncbi:MAG: PilN domain-containing protein [Comamonadaceae bacterium]|nr:PilN domain-containing protein [Pseudomonadota bacterium]MBS0610821.1 PilN domain-containing protein [Pseudomonadota bacterium]MDE2413717.1 PilN domain-containing protein [Comamonadaceae bacterium]